MFSQSSIQVLQNTSRFDEPSIRITSLDDGWEASFKNYFYSTGTPTDAVDWKKGVFFFYEPMIGPMRENIEPKSVLAVPPRLSSDANWSGDYFTKGSSAYDFWLKKKPCDKCHKERTAAICYSCIELATQRDYERMKKLPMNETPTDPVALPSDSSLPEIKGEAFQLLGELNNDMHHFFGQLSQLMQFMKLATMRHGGHLHYPGCLDCIEEQRAWLSTNHPNWREMTKEANCCSICISRAYKTLKDTPPTIQEAAPVSKRPSLIEAVAISAAASLSN